MDAIGAVSSSQLKKRANADYWRQKIRSNMIRDRRTTDLLTASGWHVSRLWEGHIRANPEGAALLVEKVSLEPPNGIVGVGMRFIDLFAGLGGFPPGAQESRQHLRLRKRD